jgi:hypothetical protein
LRRLTRTVTGILLICALITGGVVYGRRSASNGYACLAVLDGTGKPVELLEVHTGARYTFRREVTPWVDLTLRRTSPDGKYVAQIQSLGSRKYTLVVTERAGDRITTSQANLVTAPDPSDYGYHDIVWSPDSSRLALVWSHRPPQERFIVTLKIDGTDLQRRDNVSFLHGWSVDGQNLAVSLATGSQGFNRPLYLWSLAGAKWAVVSRSGYETIAAVWSPTDPRLAFVERPAGNLQGAAWLGIASAAGGSVTRLALPSAVQQTMARLLWSPDGRYLAVIYDSQMVMMLSLIDASKGTTILQTPIDEAATRYLPQLWLENSQVLTFVRGGSGYDWVKYYLEENRYETIVQNIQYFYVWNYMSISGKVIAGYLRNASYHVDLITPDGTNRVALIANANRRPNLWLSPDNKALLISWATTQNGQSWSHLTWVTGDGGNPHTLTDNFQSVDMLKWLEGATSFVVKVKQDTESSIRLIKIADGSQQVLFKGSPSFIPLNNLEAEVKYLSLMWKDANGENWIDAYNSDGKRIYHFRVSYYFAGSAYLSPDSQNILFLSKPPSSGKFELLISSANEQQIRPIRSEIGLMNFLVWSPDSKMFAVGLDMANGAPTIEVIAPNGIAIQSFDATNIRGEVKWVRCDSHE